jgi:hypothetical protein
MPVPNSGPLGLYKDIFTEFTQHSQGNNSLHSASIEAGFSTPDAMGDFYGYTDAVAPTMFSQNASSVTDSSMIAHGGISSDGGAALTEKGLLTRLVQLIIQNIQYPQQQQHLFQDLLLV